MDEIANISSSVKYLSNIPMSITQKLYTMFTETYNKIIIWLKFEQDRMKIIEIINNYSLICNNLVSRDTE